MGVLKVLEFSTMAVATSFVESISCNSSPVCSVIFKVVSTSISHTFSSKKIL